VSAYALAAGAEEVVYVPEIGDALALAKRLPRSVVCAEVDGLPVEGVQISNSPTMVAAADLEGRTLIQRSSAGVQVLARAAERAPENVFAASLVVAAATADRIRRLDPDEVTLVPSRPDHPEDPACAAYLKALLEQRPADLEELLAPLRASDRYQELLAGRWPGFPPSDLTLSLMADRFDFALPVERGPHGYLRVKRSR
jgi:2-phosphosulfolactate phosphatase